MITQESWDRHINGETGLMQFKHILLDFDGAYFAEVFK